MNCKGCGRPIPERYLRLDSFECPYCGRRYRRTAPTSARPAATRQRPAAASKRLNPLMLIGIILAAAVALLVILGLIFGVPGVIAGCIVIVIVAGVAMTLINVRNAKKNPVVKIEIVNEVKEGNHSLVTFRETYADGNAGIKLIRSNSANYALELATMQTLENNAKTAPHHSATRSSARTAPRRQAGPVEKIKQLASRRIWKLPLGAWVALVLLVVIVGNVIGSVHEDRETEKYAKLAAEHAQVETEFQKGMASLTAEPIVEADVPVATEVPATSAPTQNVPAVPTEYLSALSKAATYSEIMHMSKKGIYDQLTSEYGEAFSAEAAQYAIENLTADWNANALSKAQDYSESMHMSKAGVYDQLISEYGEQFTPEEAQYAVNNMTADWNANALAKAQSYQQSMSMSPEEIYNQLISEYGEKFTTEEAQYAVTNLN